MEHLIEKAVWESDTKVPSGNVLIRLSKLWVRYPTTQGTVLKASPGTAMFGRDMLFDIPFLADRNNIGDFRQCQTYLNTEHENKTCKDWDYQVGNKVLQQKDGILHKSTAVINVMLGLSHLFIQMAQ
jgi:hypothetical protein